MPIELSAATDSEGLAANPDLVATLAAQGVTTLDAAAARGRAHWVAFFADAEGFTRDLVDYVRDCALDWDSAAAAERFQVDPWECELGVPLQSVLQNEGVTVFAEVFARPPGYWREKLATRSLLFCELEALLAANRLAW